MDALEGTDGERLRLPLLLPDDNILVDISTQGDEISIPPLSFTAQLTQQAQKLPWTKILSKPLGTIDDDTAEERPEIPPVLIAKETIHKARAEIGITLEVIDQLLLAEKKANKDAAISYLRVLTAPEKPPPGDRRHTEDLQLNIASKLQVYRSKTFGYLERLWAFLTCLQKHLSDIAAYLADVAERLQISTTRDQAFYGELTAQLREKDWIIQSKTLDGFRQTMYLDYTYQNGMSQVCDAR
ncbi:hypothetical protein HKX48_006596 [Thoreauomyces humboldtii]|nr:hypothetical protein HKX48_006596 [Thoreauomyces humboldtii]